MRKTITLLLAVLMVMSLCACGGASQQSAAPAEGGAAAAEDKELVAGIDAAPSVLDMHQTSALVDYRGLTQVYDTLVAKDANGNLVGSLAESWEASEDGMTYTFTVRNGVKFSNGAPLTTADIAWSINRAVESPFSSYNFPAIESAEAADDTHVVIHLKAPSVSFLETLTGGTASIGCQAVFEEYGDEFGRIPEAVVGTGPYILTEWTPGQTCSFVANEDYFLGAPSVKHLRIKTISDPSSAVIALQTGDIGYYFNSVPEVAVPTIQGDKSLTLETFSSTKLGYISINNEDSLFSDVRVRQAVACGIDRAKILAMGLDDAGEVISTMAGNDYVAHPDTSWYEYDLEKAQKLLADAGKTGAHVVIETYSSNYYPKIATALQDELTKIGFEAEVKILEINAMINDLETGNFQLCVTGWTTTTKDTGDFFSLVFDSANLGVSNDARFSNEEVDALLAQAVGEQDPEARIALHTQIAEIAKEEAPYVPLFVTSENRAFTSELSIEPGNVQHCRIYDFSWNA